MNRADDDGVHLNCLVCLRRVLVLAVKHSPLCGKAGKTLRQKAGQHPIYEKDVIDLSASSEFLPESAPPQLFKNSRSSPRVHKVFGSVRTVFAGCFEQEASLKFIFAGP